MKKNTAKQNGYILIEILIGVVIVLGLTIWWVKQKNIDDQNKVAQHMTQQINEIRSACINYYEDNLRTVQWPYLSSQVTTSPQDDFTKTLIQKGYLPAADYTNPYGHTYKISYQYKTIKPTLLVISSDVPIDQARVANKAIEPIADASVVIPPKTAKTKDTNVATIALDIPTPTSGLIDPKAVHYVDIVQSGTFVAADEAKCGPTYHTNIYTAMTSCHASNASNLSEPMEACNSWAQPSSKNGKTGWEVDSQILTPDGWLLQSASNKSNGHSLIQVTLRCQQT